MRQPQCPVCGDPQLAGRHDPRIVLSPTRKVYTADGGHRISRPEDTFARLEKHISPLTGAVTSVRRQTIEDNGVAYSYASGHNFALMQDSLYFLRKNLRGRSGGKGRTDHQAKVGAVCEAVERFNGIYRGDEPHVDGSYAQLSDRALHPEELLLFSDAQYADRDALERVAVERAITSSRRGWIRSARSSGRRRGRCATTGSCSCRRATAGTGIRISAGTSTAPATPTGARRGTQSRRRSSRG